MFTGIVQGMAAVAAVQRRRSGVRLLLDLRGGAARLSERQTGRPAPGDSICVSGVCLTLVEPGEDGLVFDVVAETLSRTTLGEKREGDAVNLEASVTPGQPLGGHFMQGHVDGVGVVTRVRRDEREHRVAVEPPAGLMELVPPKGSVAVDGVSLTAAAVTPRGFEIALIPATVESTTLGGLAVGDRVNLEADILSKTVVHWLKRQRESQGGRGSGGEGGEAGLTLETLRRAGFVHDASSPPVEDHDR